MKNIYSVLYPSFPRQLGFPYRVTCKNNSEFYTTIKKNIKHRRVFASVYNYVNNPFHINKILNLDKIFFDFDGLTDDVVSEVEQFVFNLKKDNIKHLVCFSGGGFHVYIFNENYVDIDSKKGTLLNLHNHFINEYKLKNVDRSVIGDIARIATVPNTFNFKRKKFCVPLTYDKLFNIDFDTIGESQEKINQDFISGKTSFDISNFNTDEIQFDSLTEEDVPDIKTRDILLSQDIKNDKILNEIPVCVKDVLLSGREKYIGTYERMLIIVYFRDSGYPIGNIVEIIKQYLTTSRKGVKEWQHCLKEKQIEFIFSSGYKYVFPTCESLMEREYCKLNDFCDFSKEYHDENHVLKVYK
jgi:hypothetical protein